MELTLMQRMLLAKLAANPRPIRETELDEHFCTHAALQNLSKNHLIVWMRTEFSDGEIAMRVAISPNGLKAIKEQAKKEQ